MARGRRQTNVGVPSKFLPPPSPNPTPSLAHSPEHTNITSLVVISRSPIVIVMPLSKLQYA